MKPYSIESLKKMSLVQRATLYDNCLRKAEDSQAQEIMALIESSGLDFRKSGEISEGDPEMRVIELIVNSPSNEQPMVEAALRGEPPLTIVEPQIVEKLGEAYDPGRGCTVAAGYLVAKRMYALGFEKGNSKPMPAGSVAKSAATFRRPGGARK